MQANSSMSLLVVATDMQSGRQFDLCIQQQFAPRLTTKETLTKLIGFVISWLCNHLPQSLTWQSSISEKIGGYTVHIPLLRDIGDIEPGTELGWSKISAAAAQSSSANIADFVVTLDGQPQKQLEITAGGNCRSVSLGRGRSNRLLQALLTSQERRASEAKLRPACHC